LCAVLLAPLSAATQCYQVSRPAAAAAATERIQSAVGRSAFRNNYVRVPRRISSNRIEKCVLQSPSEELRDEHQGPLAGPRPPAPGVQRLHVRHDRPLLGQRRRRLPDGQEEAQPESGRPHMAAARLAPCPRHC